LKFLPTVIDGAWVIEPDFKRDERGLFARVWDLDAFAAHGLSMAFVQCNNSLSHVKGTLRGLHWQREPAAEIKVVRCIRGAIYDVSADVRTHSPTLGKYAGVELTAGNRLWMYVPSGCAHGFLTLEDDSEVIYASTAPYAAYAERGIRWNDPKFAIKWPQTEPVVISGKDGF
jgi:dTDP-4-dehydrorhamnose 3,5-epimerase